MHWDARERDSEQLGSSSEMADNSILWHQSQHAQQSSRVHPAAVLPFGLTGLPSIRPRGYIIHSVSDNQGLFC